MIVNEQKTVRQVFCYLNSYLIVLRDLCINNNYNNNEKINF
jgi:hypothetical protein